MDWTKWGGIFLRGLDDFVAIDKEGNVRTEQVNMGEPRDNMMPRRTKMGVGREKN